MTGTTFLDAQYLLPDAFLQLCVPEFEYPRRVPPPAVRFVGTLPLALTDVRRPAWADELDGRPHGRHAVLVTQGTVANRDLGELIAPTLQALADTDAIVAATTGGPGPEAIPVPIPVPIPPDARVERWLPYDRLLPRVDVAGVKEDKARAKTLAAAFARHDTGAEIIDVIEGVARGRAASDGGLVREAAP